MLSTAQQPEAQATKPGSQRYPHEVPSQVATAFTGAAGHGVQRVPHVATSPLGAHWPAHAWKPLLQAKAQAVPLHVAVALAGVAQGAQAPEHSRCPELQLRPHCWLLQVAVPLVVPGQMVQRAPQLVALVSETQRWPHACWPVGQTQTLLALQVAPMGQSVESRQPVRHARVCGSQ
jgi:hypothetical protein